jgi:hypothetical protein
VKIRRPARVRALSPARVHTPGPGRLPGDFLDELADELDASLQEARRQAERLAILAELLRVATATARRLRRPVTVLDIIESAGEQSERERVTELVRRLRA